MVITAVLQKGRDLAELGRGTLIQPGSVAPGPTPRTMTPVPGGAGLEALVSRTELTTECAFNKCLLNK